MHANHEGKQYMGYTIRTDRYRYVEWYEWNKENIKGNLTARELYDHETDPDENINIADFDENSGIVISLSKQLKTIYR
jgi:hypothetical protein